MRSFFLILPILLLAGCAARLAPVIGAADNEIEATATNIEAVNDVKAKAYMKLQCAISIGASYRVLTPRQRESVNASCNPAMANEPLPADPESVSLETLRVLGIGVE